MSKLYRNNKNLSPDQAKTWIQLMKNPQHTNRNTNFDTDSTDTEIDGNTDIEEVHPVRNLPITT